MTKWTHAEIHEVLMILFATYDALPVTTLDWWARNVEIKTSDLFHVLASSPEFVYRESIEGYGDWAWTLRDKDACPTTEPCDGKVVYATGACRSSDGEDERYDLISPIALERWAKTSHEGAVKRGAMNWERGFRVVDCANRAIRHLYKYLHGDRSEDHIGHAQWNVGGMAHSEVMWPELNRGTLRGKGGIAPGCPGYVDPIELASQTDNKE